MAALRHQQFVGPEQYLEIDRRSDFKSEYISGEMIAMSGASLRHGRIVANLARDLGTALRGKPCQSIPGDLRVRVTATAYLYPDLVVYCGEPELQDEEYLDTLLNPTAIFEVLSKSNESYDRGEKGFLYRQLGSLQSYVLLSQDSPVIELYTRQPNGDWSVHQEAGMEGALDLLSIGVRLLLSDIYDGIDFKTTQPNK